MPSHTLYVVEAFEERDGGVVPAEPRACPSEAAARALAVDTFADPRWRHRLVEDG